MFQLKGSPLLMGMTKLFSQDAARKQPYQLQGVLAKSKADSLILHLPCYKKIVCYKVKEKSVKPDKTPPATVQSYSFTKDLLAGQLD